MLFSQVGKFASLPGMLAGIAFPPLILPSLVVTGYSTVTSVMIKSYILRDMKAFGEDNVGRG